MIRGESDSDQKMASEADLDIVELLCAGIICGRAVPCHGAARAVAQLPGCIGRRLLPEG